MNLTQFKDWAVSQGSVAKYTDGQYRGQCVSLINQYLARVYGIQAGAWGNAKDWATNGSVLSHFDKVGSPQAGDIGVSGATATNPYGHIWIYLSPTQCLEQNGRTALRVSINAPLFKPIAILRRKGTTGGFMAKLALGPARILAECILGRDRDYTHAGKGDGDLNAHHVGRELTNEYIESLWLSAEAKAAAHKRGTQENFYNTYVNAIADLQARPTKAQLEDLSRQLQAEAQKVKEAETKLAEEQAKRTEDSKQLDEAGNAIKRLVEFVKGLLKR